jgi:methylenetetrahydrofolate reductase (NADPH)
LMGGRAIACLNARDRNLLGFQRDLLTAAAYGVDQFLFVYGDRPASGDRTGELTVRSMIQEARAFNGWRSGRSDPFRIGVTTGLAPLPGWKREADFLFVQVSFSLTELMDWRASIDFAGPVFAGVMIVPSAAMARKLTADIPQLAVPQELVDLIDTDPDAGIESACQLVRQIKDSNSFDGVHLIPVSRYREAARKLERLL